MKMNETPTNSVPPKKVKRIIWIIVITVVGFPILVCLSFWTLISFDANRTLHKADSGFKEAKKTINPEQLRTWALEEIPKYPQPKNDIFPPKIPNSEIPSYIQSLYAQLPEDAVVQKKGYVQIFWGGPFFHWGFEIGPTNFVPAADSYVTRVEWVPGIYYNREDTAHPFK